MIDFGFNNIEEVKKELRDSAQFKKDLEALEKFAVVFSLYDVLKKNPEIKKWGVIFEKYATTTEGLDFGVYANYATSLNKEMLVIESIEDEHKFAGSLTDIHRSLNSCLYEYFCSRIASEDNFVFPVDEYASDESGMCKFINDFIGEDYLNKWLFSSQKKALDEKIKTPSTKIKASKI